LRARAALQREGVRGQFFLADVESVPIIEVSHWVLLSPVGWLPYIGPPSAVSTGRFRLRVDLHIRSYPDQKGIRTRLPRERQVARAPVRFGS
jgi:hypothetical protein